ncbi:MAG: hypothetical protein JWN66_4769 [Sphingomonas bacterium]|uniref:tetratricopeptide repeat protein n=1 Tax=Sphingomonas bacterium TaxID=1895847 RepID=UPI00260DD36C|nr:tetratricopeptide repeat protein [Sphingomonas bacterium]MDB5707653.1 hypothetical protein [Sphingomonas bacterium]
MDRDLLAEAVDHLHRDDTAGAESRLRRILALNASHPIALYLLGVIRIGGEQWSEAESLLRRALVLSPDQPQVMLHLARVLRATGRSGEAVALYRPVLAQRADDAEIWLELALALEETGDIAAAAIYGEALRRAPDLAEASLRLARLLLGSGDPAKAEAVLRQALSAAAAGDAGTRARIESELGVALKLLRRHEEALDHLDAAAALAPGPQVQTRRAVVLQHLRRFDDAIAALERALADDPLDMDTHVALNEILWRQGRDDAFLASYDVAMRARPESILPHVAKGQFLLKTERAGDALDAFGRALAIAPHDGAALAGSGRALELLGEHEAARARHLHNVALYPEEPAPLVDCAGFLLRQGEAADAGALAARAHNLAPTSQEALALLGLCHRVSGSDEEYHLNGYDSLVRVFDLDAPPGCGTVAAFNHDLAGYLDELHGDKREYVTQTLRGGTRLFDQVFNNGHALVEKLRERIQEAVSCYIRELSASGPHPFVDRRSAQVAYAGSWSSRLSDQGFHLNHIHPSGWISSAYYVAVPEVTADDKAQQGWLKIGEPTADFGRGFGPRRMIQPRAGRLVLFPSYLWHGTTPFHSPQSRTTIAFDVKPA